MAQKRWGPEYLAQDHEYHSPKLAIRQAIWIALGFMGMFVGYKVDYRRWKDVGLWLLLISLFLLALVYVPGIGKPINDHRRWIGLGLFTIQPSEFAKLALIIFMARMLTDRHDKITTSFLHGVAPALFLTGAFDLVIIAEPDIGAALILSAIIFLMWFIGGMRIQHLAGLVLATLGAFACVISMFPSRFERIIAFVRIIISRDPTSDIVMGKGHQLIQSLIAVGSGGTWGVGVGNSVQKYFLTEQHSEFIFAIICEELGLVGAGLLVLAFFVLIWEGWRVALRAPDFYANLLASGITLMIAISVLLNFMVVLGLAPTKGLSLPLVSHGGSNMLVTLTALGILMNIGKYVEREAEDAPPRTSRPRSPDRPSRSGRARENRKWYERELAG
jgi:cell division protein FtsW